MERFGRQKQSTTPHNRIYLTLGIVIGSAGLAIMGAVGRTGEGWMLPMVSGVLASIFLFRQVKDRRQKISARQALIQTYLDRLLRAETPEDRQNLLNEMSARQFLKGIRLSSSDLEDLDLSFADFSGADLSGATLSGADLTGANLTGATLSYATLSYTTLNGAIFKGAKLRGANLRGADLRHADFSNAFMRGAVLEQATLTGAVMLHAQLHGANLQAADLREADLRDAILTRATLPDGDKWDTCTEVSRFTDPDHGDFWQAEKLSWPVYRMH
jgi:hypothetical protein